MQCRTIICLITAIVFSCIAPPVSAQDMQLDAPWRQAESSTPPKIKSESTQSGFFEHLHSEYGQTAFGETANGPIQSDSDNPPLAIRELRPPPLLFATIDLTAPTDDLWQRLRNGFSMPGLNNELVLQQQQWYLNHPDYLRRVVERSRPYIHHIIEEIESRGMPTELALLPIVESAFNPIAQSPAQAAGLWQFIPATGKRFDLKQNWWHDQRRDIVASTEAALEYLQAVYEMHGDWHLALASYNWGEGAVKKAIQKNIARGLPTDYSSLTMPEETRQYVPKLIALKNIFSDPATLSSLNIPFIPNRPYFATIETGRPIDVRLAARLAGMSLEEFIKLNPAHNRPVISGESTLVIPADRFEIFRNNLDRHEAPLSNWQLYTTRSTERLDKLAPRFGISLADLKRVNGIKGGMRIAAGTALLVPAQGGDSLRHTPQHMKAPQALADPPPRRTLKRGKSTVINKKPGGKETVIQTRAKAAHHRALTQSGGKPSPKGPLVRSTTKKPAAKTSPAQKRHR